MTEPEEKYFVFNERYGSVDAIQWFRRKTGAFQEAKQRKRLGLREDEHVYVGELLLDVEEKDSK